MSKAKYGLTHLEKLANEIEVIYTQLVNLEHVGSFLTVEFNTDEEPVQFPAFNSLVAEHLCKITQVTAREGWTGSIVSFFIEQDK